jgi:arylamine N-acetyltransferase
MEDIDDAFLVEAYCLRLGVSQPLEPSLETLSLLTERHLQYIPFENLSMHTVPTGTCKNAPPPPTIALKLPELVEKILIQRRGGVCLELNGLFAEFLQAIGYKVRLVPTWVSAGPERGHEGKRRKFRVQQSHFILAVQVVAMPCYDDDDKDAAHRRHRNGCTTFFVDVGLGEPPCHPLEYSIDTVGTIQMTPEGMQSRIVWDERGTWIDGSGRARMCLVQEWLIVVAAARGTTTTIWEPRLQWDVADAPLVWSSDQIDDDASKTGRALESCGSLSLSSVVSTLLHPSSSFSKKLICCKLTRDSKVSLAGCVLKRTKNRFVRIGHTTKPTVVLTSILTEQEVYDVLQTEFGIVLRDCRIDFTASRNLAHTKLWTHL